METMCVRWGGNIMAGSIRNALLTTSSLHQSPI